MSYKTDLPEETLKHVKQLGIYTASTLDGYWEERAMDDLNYVYLLGQLKAIRSFQQSYGKRSTRIRMPAVKRRLIELKKKCQL